jgi:Tol biopolymer transport system component
MGLQERLPRQERQLTWFDRQGKTLDQVSEPGNTGLMNISPDGTRQVFARLDADTGNFDIWLTELARGVTTRVTFDPANDNFPIWSPDGSRIAFNSPERCSRAVSKGVERWGP